jgi:8-oxo-dGTP pyrophosphatase MutT (NUDIX family)
VSDAIRTVFSGRVITVNVERVTLPNGSTADLEIIHHPGGAAVVAADSERRICLLRQYRHAAGGWVWELPAGKIDNREPPLETAQRELQEEAGRQAGRWDSLGEYLSSPGVFTEVVHLYLATDLTPIEHRPEEHEVFEVHWMAYVKALEMAQSGELRDGKSVVGIFRAMSRLRPPG